MIASILDTDLYKFTTSYAYMKLYPDAEGEFVFKDRDETIYDDAFLALLNQELLAFSTLKLTHEEFLYVTGKIRFIPQCYWEWLSGFHFEIDKIKVELDAEKHLHISVCDKLYKVTLYEVPLLALVSEVRSKYLGFTYDKNQMISRLKEKIYLSNQNRLLFSEFGTRRRFSFEVQEIVIQQLAESAPFCTGTSNVHFAMKYNLKPMGTHPHEWFMFHGAVFGYKQANYLGLEDWVKVYDGDLGIALSDTYTVDVFLKNFSRKHAKLFDGVRHDSGDPKVFVDKVIKRYQELEIDPTTKIIIFSNALNFPDFKEIADYCKGKIKCSAGIGTNLTNDTGNKPANIVMKLMRTRINARQNWSKCIKISDDVGKFMGDDKEFDICKYECNISE